jgi:hypothetical protein
MWGKDYDAEVKTAELSLDKAKAESLLQYNGINHTYKMLPQGGDRT